jgi:hypothetical protein
LLKPLPKKLKEILDTKNNKFDGQRSGRTPVVNFYVSQQKISNLILVKVH